MGISKFENIHDKADSQDADGMQKKKYDLEVRTERFSIRIRDFCLRLKSDTINIDQAIVECIRQLVRSAASVAGNYLEANENLGEGDVKFRIKVCRKESKESALWLNMYSHTMTQPSKVKEGS